MPMFVPTTMQHLFWDVDPQTLTPEHARFIIERVLDWGDIQAVNWVLHTFPRSLIVEVLRTSRRLSSKSAMFWAVMFDVNPQEVQSLKQRRWNTDGFAGS